MTFGRDNEDLAGSGRTVLFEPFAAGGLTLSSRIVMAPMGRAHAPQGIADARYADYFRKRIEGGTGLIITGATAIGHDLADYDGTGPLFHGDASLAAWSEIVAAVHAAGGKIIPQLWHTGMARVTERFASSDAIGPSGLALGDLESGQPSGRVMSPRDLEEVRQAYAAAARTAKALGFDGIEIHAGHGFLLDQFLWDATNRRTDDYGGSAEKRARFPAEVVAACREAVGPDFPILMRISQFKIEAYDARIADDPEELAALVRPLAEAGVDIFHCSQREVWAPAFAGSTLNLAGWVRQLTGKPTIAVGSVGLGGLFTEEEAAQPTASLPRTALGHLDAVCAMMDRGEFDLLAVGRSLLADADWAQKVREHRDADIHDLTLAALTEI